jgi:type I restriction enzyme M protein
VTWDNQAGSIASSPPEVIAQEIVEDLEAALAEFAAIAESLRADPQ